MILNNYLYYSTLNFYNQYEAKYNFCMDTNDYY